MHGWLLGLSLRAMHVTASSEDVCSGLACRCDLARLDAATVTVATLEELRLPVVLEGMTGGWAAFERWRLPRFRELYDNAAVAFVASAWASFEGNLTMQNLTHQIRSHHTSPNSLIFSDYPSGFVRHLRGDYSVPSVLHRFSLMELFTLGGMGPSATPATYHAVAWLALVHGAKHWFLHPPGTDWPGFAPKCDYARDVSDRSTVLQCVQKPGEVIFLPEGTWHATCNPVSWTVGIGGQNAVAGVGAAIGGVLQAAWEDDLVRLEALQKESGSSAIVGPGAGGLQPLHFAIRHGSKVAVAFLIKQGADVNGLDYNRSLTPWKEEREPIMRNHYDFRGFRPLHLAARWGDVEILRLLLASGADTTLTDMRGRTAVHWAAFRSQLSCLRELQRASADMDRPDKDGLTPLLTTLMESGWLSTTKLLLEAGANASYVNTNAALRKYACRARAGAHLAPVLRSHTALILQIRTNPKDIERALHGARLYECVILRKPGASRAAGAAHGPRCQCCACCARLRTGRQWVLHTRRPQVRLCNPCCGSVDIGTWYRNSVPGGTLLGSASSRLQRPR